MFTYLFDGFLLRVFSLLRASGVLYIAWLEGVGHLLVQDSFRFSLGISAAVSIYLITSTTVLKIPVLLLRPEFDTRFALLFTATSVFKTDFLIPISADEKGCYFRFRILANHLASFFCQAIRSDYYLFPPVTECKHLLAFILTWICYFGREELTYIPIPLLTVSLWRPANSNTEG